MLPYFYLLCCIFRNVEDSMSKVQNVILSHYDEDQKLYSYLMHHSQAVAKKAINIGQKIDENVDIKFLKEAALLHDIGIYKTDLPELNCYGKQPYIRHGIIGKKILEEENLPEYGKVCERHIGVGISEKDILKQNLPLPNRNMEPKTIEEKIITYADLFYSKNKNKLNKEQSIQEIEGKLSKLGSIKVNIFRKWLHQFENKRMKFLKT